MRPLAKFAETSSQAARPLPSLLSVAFTRYFRPSVPVQYTYRYLDIVQPSQHAATSSTKLHAYPSISYYGRVTAVLGLLVEVGGVAAPLCRSATAARSSPATDGSVPCEVVGFRDGRALADAVRRPRRRRPRLQGRGRRMPSRWCARPRAGSAAWSTRWASRSTARVRCSTATIAYPLRNQPAARPFAPARRRQDRSRRARDQHLPHLLPRPAHGHLRRLRRRQVGAACR